MTFRKSIFVFALFLVLALVCADDIEPSVAPVVCPCKCFLKRAGGRMRARRQCKTRPGCVIEKCKTRKRRWRCCNP